MEMSSNGIISKMCWGTSPFKSHGNIVIYCTKVEESPIIQAYICNWLTLECLKLAYKYFYEGEKALRNKTLKKISL